MENGNVINLQDFEQNEIPLKQRSFEDSIDTFLSLFDADLLLIWMNKFWNGFRFRSASCPVLRIMLIISRGECSTSTGLSRGKYFFQSSKGRTQKMWKDDIEQ